MREHENESRLVAEFDKNSMELVKVHLTRWHNVDYVDVRVWVKGEPGSSGAEQPTTRGIRISAELLPDLRSAIDVAIEALEDGPKVEIVHDGAQGSRESR
jgi:hypothetical protein